MNALLRQLSYAIANLIGVALLCFAVLFLVHNEEPHSWTQSFNTFFSSISSGEFGVTLDGQPIWSEVITRLPATIELWISAFILAFVLGIPAGVASATHPNKWQDKWVESFALIGFSLPVFWWALLLVLWFSLELGLMPVSERIGFVYDIESISGFILLDSLLAYPNYGLSAFANALQHLAMPVIVLAILPTAIVARVTKTALRNVLSSDYIRMAKGQGISEQQLVWKYGLANVAAPLLQILTLQLSSLFTGVFLIEYIFSWPGVTSWLLERIHAGDNQSVIMGGFLIASFLVLVNAFMDALSTLANPRVRRSR